MDASKQATTKLLARGLANVAGLLPAYLILAGLLLVSSGRQALAQQATKINPSNAPSKLPSKVPSSKPSNLPSNPSNPSNDVQQLLAAGQAAQDNGRFDEAIATYNRVIALSANNARNAAVANLKIGNAYMVQRKFENAAIGYQRAATLNPDYAEAYNNLGEALGELKQYPRAIEAFNKAFALDPTLLKAKYNQAVTYDRMGNFRYSEFVFRNLIKSSPEYSLAYDGLAVTLSKAGRAKEAIAFHEKAIALNPREPSYYFNCAISYLMLRNTAKALEQQEKLKEIDPAIADRLASVIVKRQM
ncbi:MAG: tetratricopeptide repeat protein [Acidobacteriota bacterium]|nr:tetratricopeptide repeat protein [Acidobacteriota bacterium]